eukprot:4252883-Pyramimonas_sp.AAC.1
MSPAVSTRPRNFDGIPRTPPTSSTRRRQLLPFQHSRGADQETDNHSMGTDHVSCKPSYAGVERGPTQRSTTTITRQATSS